MADSSPRDSADSTAASKPTYPSPATGWAKWIPAATALLAIAALACGVAGWFLPSSGASYSADQTAQAKKQICAEAKTVNRAVVTNTHRANPGQKDPTGSLAIAANARLALYGGGDYLEDRLAKLPATSSELADAVNAMAGTLQQLGIAYLADAGNDTLQPLRNALTAQTEQVNKLCQ